MINGELYSPGDVEDMYGLLADCVAAAGRKLSLFYMTDIHANHHARLWCSRSRGSGVCHDFIQLTLFAMSV